MQEYLDLKHAELVPGDRHPPTQRTGVLFTHARCPQGRKYYHKAPSCVWCLSKIEHWHLFERHPLGGTHSSPYSDVLLRFRTHRIALTTDVSKMYGAVKLITTDRYLYRFVWRNNPKPTPWLQNDKGHLRCIGLLLCSQHICVMKCSWQC